MTIAAALLLAAACAPTQSDLGTTRSFYLAENYQAVHRRMAQAASCASGGILLSPTKFIGESQLYGDLGLGEASVRMNSGPVNSFAWTSEVRREGDGARVTIRGSSATQVDAAAKVATGETRANCI